MLSESQKYEILRMLCYPLGTIDSNSMDFSNIIKRKLDAVNGAAQVEVEKILSWINETEDQLDARIANGNVKRVDDIEFFENGSADLRVERNRYKRELSQLLGLRNLCGGSVNGSVCV